MGHKVAKRRFRFEQERRGIVEQTLKPGASVSQVARAHDINAKVRRLELGPGFAFAEFLNMRDVMAPVPGVDSDVDVQREHAALRRSIYGH